MARDSQGRFDAAHDDDAAAVLDAMTDGETYTTGELADAVDAPRRTIYEYLVELEAGGAVTSKQPNERLRLWSIDRGENNDA